MIPLPAELDLPSGFPKPGYYRHTDGGLYKLIGPGYHTEEKAILCAYLHVYPFDQLLWLRPLSEWSSRFTWISEEEAIQLMAVPRIQAKMNISQAKAIRKNSN